MLFGRGLASSTHFAVRLCLNIAMSPRAQALNTQDLRKLCYWTLESQALQFVISIKGIFRGGWLCSYFNQPAGLCFLFPTLYCMVQLKSTTISLWEKLHCPWVCISRFNCLLFSTSRCQDWGWTVLYSTDLICPRSGLAFYLLFSFWQFISSIKDVCSNGRAILVPSQDIPSCWAPMGLTIHLLDAFHQGCLNSTMNASSWMPTRCRQALLPCLYLQRTSKWLKHKDSDSSLKSITGFNSMKA